MSYLLSGQNSVGLDERVSQLRTHLDPTDLGSTVIDVQSSTLQEIAAACQAMPFFGGIRVVVLVRPIAPAKRGEKESLVLEPETDEASSRITWPELSDLLKTVPSTTQVIMRHDGALTATHYMAKAVKSMGWKLESFPMLHGQELLQWLSQRVSEQGGSIDQHAAVHLLNRLFPQVWNAKSNYSIGTPDVRLLATEVEKLVVAADGAAISRELVEDLVVDREGYVAFKLNDATFSGNAGAALVELSDVLDAGDAPERVMAQIAGEATGISAAHALTAFQPREVAAASGVTEGRLGMLQKRIASVSPAAQVRISESIRRAGATLRSTESNAPAVITPLVAEIAEAVRASKLDRSRN